MCASVFSSLTLLFTPWLLLSLGLPPPPQQVFLPALLHCICLSAIFLWVGRVVKVLQDLIALRYYPPGGPWTSILSHHFRGSSIFPALARSSVYETCSIFVVLKFMCSCSRRRPIACIAIPLYLMQGTSQIQLHNFFCSSCIWRFTRCFWCIVLSLGIWLRTCVLCIILYVYRFLCILNIYNRLFGWSWRHWQLPPSTPLHNQDPHSVVGRFALRLLAHACLEISHGCLNVVYEDFHEGIGSYSSQNLFSSCGILVFCLELWFLILLLPCLLPSPVPNLWIKFPSRV